MSQNPWSHVWSQLYSSKHANLPQTGKCSPSQVSPVSHTQELATEKSQHWVLTRGKELLHLEGQT